MGEGGSSRNMYEGHRDKAKRGQDPGREVGMDGTGEWWGENGDNCT